MSLSGFLKKCARIYSEYRDSVSELFFEKFNCLPPDRKKILLVSHELTHTGAPIVLLNIAKILKKRGYSVGVISLRGGSLKSEFEREEIPVCISMSVQRNTSEIKRLCNLFDLVICNTVITYRVVNLMNPKIKVLWLLHEAKVADCLASKSKNLVKVLENVQNIYTVSEYAKSVIDKYSNNVKIIYNGISDVDYTERAANERLQIAFVGTVNHRKAVDIYAEAVRILPHEYRQKADFTVVGDYSESFAEKLRQSSKVYLNWIGAVSEKKRMNGIYQKMDLLVCVSRDDPAPLVIGEAAAYGVPSVISEDVGSTYLIKDDESGFIVPTEDVEALRDVFIKVIDSPEILSDMRKKVRENYLRTSSMEIFENNLLNIVDRNFDGK